MSLALIYLVFHYILVLFYKWNGPEWVAKIGGGGIFAKMAECEFCMETWIGLIFTISFIGHTGEIGHLIYWPALVSISNIIKMLAND